MNYINAEIKEYHKILCADYPVWLDDYLNTLEMQNLKRVGVNCGTNYCGIYNPPYIYTNFDHSVGVALIIWNFTKDKKVTLAGLFHDIATPVFKHCIDFMNNDHEVQESTEEKTYQMIFEAKEIMKLLCRDNIKIDEVFDYKIYPIADNSAPQLAADRLEYTFSGGLHFTRIFELEDIKKIYKDMIVCKNEKGIDEICFKSKALCEEYVRRASKIWPKWRDTNNRTTMQFLADITKCMLELNYLTIEDLYTLSEDEVVNLIKNCDNGYIKNAFYNFENVKEAKESDVYLDNKYCINVNSKRRYVNPFVINEGRIYDISNKSKKLIDNYLSLPNGGITYFDFEFNKDDALKANHVREKIKKITDNGVSNEK